MSYPEFKMVVGDNLDDSGGKFNDAIPTPAEIDSLAATYIQHLHHAGITDPDAASYMVAWRLFTLQGPIFTRLNSSMFDTANRWQKDGRPSPALQVACMHA